MDRNAIMAAMPSDDEFRAATGSRKKEIVEGLVSAILDALVQERREPDLWEAEHIASAIGFDLVGWYHAAITAADLSMTPLEKRARPDTWIRASDTATVCELRDGLDYAAGKPARNV